MTNDRLKCPSARPEMDGSLVFGVVRELDGRSVVQALSVPVPVTPEILAYAGSAPLGQVFRFTAACATEACAHFDGTDCRLAVKLVGLPDRVDTTPPCRIRSDCRWYVQEGRAACLVCPLILSETASPTAEMELAADPSC